MKNTNQRNESLKRPFIDCNLVIPVFNSPRWGSPRSRSPDRSPKTNTSWQSHSQGTGVPHSSMHLRPDFLSHPAGPLHAPDGRHDGNRWPHSTRGEVLNICRIFSLSRYYCPALYPSVNEFSLFAVH